MALVHVAPKTAPSRSTVQRLPSKRDRQQGRLLIDRELTGLRTRPVNYPTREIEGIKFIYAF